MKVKKILAALVAATMLLSAFSFTASADSSIVNFSFNPDFVYPATTDTFEPIPGAAYQLYEAFQNASDGDTIKLNCDIAGFAYKMKKNPSDNWSHVGPFIPEGKTITLDLNGHTMSGNPYSVDVEKGAHLTLTDTAEVKGKILAGAAAIFLGGDDSKVILTGGVVVDKNGDGGDFGMIRSYLNEDTDERYEGVEVVLDDCTINGGTRTAIYLNSNKFAKVTINNAIITAGTLINSNVNTPDFKINNGEFNVNKIITSDAGGELPKVEINGGKYSESAKESLEKILPENKSLVLDEEGKLIVKEANAKIEPEASSLGFTVSVEGIKNNVDMSEFSTFSVKIDNVKEEDKAKFATIEGAYKAYDISIEKTDSVGAKSELNNLSSPVTATFKFDEYAAISNVKVYHAGGSLEEIEASKITIDKNKVTVSGIASFSGYAFVLTGTPVEDISQEAGITLKWLSDTKYEIIATTYSDKVMYRLMSADLTFKNTPATADDKVVYTITPAYGFKLIEAGNNRYEFHCDTEIAADVTAAKTVIGYVNFGGFGEGNFEVDANATTNVIHTAKAPTEGKDDNIVIDYVVGGEYVFKRYAPEVIDYDINVDTADLKINVLFPNNAENKAAAYEDMTVTVAGGDIDAPIVVKLGAEPVITYKNTSGNFPATQKVIASYKEIDATNKVNGYEIVLTDALVLNSTYTVTVEGAGYRTARYTVTMTADKTLNFWNNVKDTAVVIEDGKTAPTMACNFLAGDIVKDNNINIYDLSAVVSYFGTSNTVSAASAYAKYDLNRDGKIDSKDVAYVLVSWNN